DTSTAKADALLAVVMIGLGCAVLIETSRIPAPIFESFGSRPLPFVVATFIITLSIILLLRSLLRIVRQPALTRMRTAPVFVLRPVLICILLSAHAVAVGSFQLPYAWATLALVIALIVVIDGPRPRSLVAGIALGAVLAIGTDQVFTRVFMLDLP